MKKPPIRFWIALMIFFSAAQNYMMRANMSVSVVEMSKPIVPKKIKEKICEPPDFAKPKNNTKPGGDFDWNQHIQGLLLSAYFYGTMVTFFIGGTLAEMFGPVNIIFGTSIVTVLLTAVNPIAAKKGGWGGTFAIRFLTGILGGPVYPAMNVLVARWAPPVEKGKFLATLIGNTFGIVVTWLVVGFATDQWGWESGFYAVTIMLFAYCVGFYIFTTDSPQNHPWITQEERDYIFLSQGGNLSGSKKKRIPPYSRIFSSVHYWAIIVAQFGNLWGLNLMLTFTPKYFKETLNFDLKATVGYAVIPYVARLITSQVFGILGDSLRKREVLSVKNIRRLFMLFSHILPAICLCFVAVCKCNWKAALSLFVLTQALTGAVVVGHLINIQDLSPNFAGTLYGIMNFIGSTTGFFVPSISGSILASYSSQPILGASIILGLGGIVMISTALFFIIFMSAEVQPWNEVDDSEGGDTSAK